MKTTKINSSLKLPFQEVNVMPLEEGEEAQLRLGESIEALRIPVLKFLSLKKILAIT